MRGVFDALHQNSSCSYIVIRFVRTNAPSKIISDQPDTYNCMCDLQGIIKVIKLQHYQASFFVIKTSMRTSHRHTHILSETNKSMYLYVSDTI